MSLVNTVLATIVADTFREFSDAIEKGQMSKTVAQKALRESWKVIFNSVDTIVPASFFVICVTLS